MNHNHLQTMIYFYCPFHKTGGPENTHLTVSTINRLCNQVVAKVIYVTNHPKNVSLYPEIDHVTFGNLTDVYDIPTNFIVLPEIYHVDKVRQSTGIVNCRYIVWWQSFINACVNNALTNYSIKDVIHAFHSYYEYAMVRPQLTLGQPYFFLTDFIAEEYTNIQFNTFVDQKEPIVCFNGHKDTMSKSLLEDAKIPFIEIKEMNREDVNKVLQKCQVYVDLGSHPGKDHMPREAAMYGCVVVTNKSGSAAYFEDVPIYQKILFESELIPLVKNILQNYQGYVKEQSDYREKIFYEKQEAEKNIVGFIELHNKIVSIHEGILFVSKPDYLRTITENEHILKRLEEICVETIGSTRVEGNCFCENMNITNRPQELIAKQMNLYSLAMNASKIMEIGFNAGHSALLFLLANPNSHLVCFDICQHPYTIKCFNYLKSIFGNRLDLVIGDSTMTIPEYKEKHPEMIFDVCHLDGSHDVEIARKDFENLYSMVRDVIIFDDTHDTILSGLLDEYIQKIWVIEIPMRKTTMYEHRIVRKAKLIQP